MPPDIMLERKSALLQVDVPTPGKRYYRDNPKTLNLQDYETHHIAVFLPDKAYERNVEFSCLFQSRRVIKDNMQRELGFVLAFGTPEAKTTIKANKGNTEQQRSLRFVVALKKANVGKTHS